MRTGRTTGRNSSSRRKSGRSFSSSRSGRSKVQRELNRRPSVKHSTSSPASPSAPVPTRRRVSVCRPSKRTSGAARPFWTSAAAAASCPSRRCCSARREPRASTSTNWPSRPPSRTAGATALKHPSSPITAETWRSRSPARSTSSSRTSSRTSSSSSARRPGTS